MRGGGVSSRGHGGCQGAEQCGLRPHPRCYRGLRRGSEEVEEEGPPATRERDASPRPGRQRPDPQEVCQEASAGAACGWASSAAAGEGARQIVFDLRRASHHGDDEDNDGVVVSPMIGPWMMTAAALGRDPGRKADRSNRSSGVSLSPAPWRWPGNGSSGAQLTWSRRYRGCGSRPHRFRSAGAQCPFPPARRSNPSSRIRVARNRSDRRACPGRPAAWSRIP